MRTLRKSMLIAMMIMATAMSFANGNKPNVKVEKVGAKMIALQASQLGTSKTKVQLKDENGLILHSAVLNNNEKVNKRFDLTSLPAGNYSIEVENEVAFTTTPIEIIGRQAYVISGDQVTIVKPVVRQIGDFLDVILPSEDTASVNVTIYDDSFKPLYTETLNSTTELRRYDLSKLVKGGYNVKMTTKGKDFIRFVALK